MHLAPLQHHTNTGCAGSRQHLLTFPPQVCSRGSADDSSQSLRLPHPEARAEVDAGASWRTLGIRMAATQGTSRASSGSGMLSHQALPAPARLLPMASLRRTAPTALAAPAVAGMQRQRQRQGRGHQAMPCMQVAGPLKLDLEQREARRAQRATRLTQGRLAAAAGASGRPTPRVSTPAMRLGCSAASRSTRGPPWLCPASSTLPQPCMQAAPCRRIRGRLVEPCAPWTLQELPRLSGTHLRGLLLERHKVLEGSLRGVSSEARLHAAGVRLLAVACARVRRRLQGGQPQLSRLHECCHQERLPCQAVMHQQSLPHEGTFTLSPDHHAGQPWRQSASQRAGACLSSPAAGAAMSAALLCADAAAFTAASRFWEDARVRCPPLEQALGLVRAQRLQRRGHLLQPILHGGPVQRCQLVVQAGHRILGHLQHTLGASGSGGCALHMRTRIAARCTLEARCRRSRFPQCRS